MRRSNILILVTLILALVFSRPGLAPAEQDMDEYTSYPVFLSATVTPNIMVIIDNSGSMNLEAYAEHYANDPAAPAVGPEWRDFFLWESGDDGDESVFGGGVGIAYADSYVSNSWITATRFRNVDILHEAVIEEAYIEYMADAGRPFDNNITIAVEASDDAAVIDPLFNGNISGRTYVGNTVAWNIVDNWIANNKYRTPDIKSLVQEIVNRVGWDDSGRDMLFKLSGTGALKSYYSFDAMAGADSAVLKVKLAAPPLPAGGYKYYGLFNPNARYTYSSNKFVEDPGGPWSGNWLNWVSMRRIDLARKVMMGGLATSRTGGGNQTNFGAQNADRDFIKNYDSSADTTVSPYAGNFWFGIDNGYIYVDDDSNVYGGYIARFNIAIQKDITTEPEAFFEGNLSGVLQRVGDKANWGNMWFYEGTGMNKNGGYVANPIGTNMNTLITNLQNTPADTWTPQAETLYVAMQYFKQEAIDPTLSYANNATGPFNAVNDPYTNQSGVAVSCAKSFVLLLTDGVSTKDRQIPAFLQDYDADGNDPGVYGNDGTDYLDDVALYARTNDLRADLEGSQNIIFYAIYAFGGGGDAAKARLLLQSAAKNGGFEDKNGNNRPDLHEEWDENGDGIPDTYYEASDGYELEKQLMAAITAILKRASSGTAVSVLATSSEGEGTLTQAYFKPVVSTATDDVKWVGYLHSLWVDSLGRLREDSDSGFGADPGLSLDTDKIVEFFFDAPSGEAKFYRYDVDAFGNKSYIDTNGNGKKDVAEDYIFTDHLLDELNPIFGAGAKLATRASADRTIITFLDINGDSKVDAGEVLDFNTANAGALANILAISAQTHLGAIGDRAKNLIKFTRGDNSGFLGATDLRYRTIDGDIWKLGDIVHSTPVTLGRPLDNYGVIYGDQSYQDYFDLYRSRESIIYVGANDGMLHAFLLGRFVSGDNPATVKAEVAYLERAAATTEDFGDEVWAFIPQALLPHLKWLSDPDYTHVYYVDLKPKLVDAQVFPVDAKHPNGWGTILIGGLNLGGKSHDVNDTAGVYWKTFVPSMFAIDVTDPHNPNLLWEKTYPNLQMSTSIATVARVADGGNGKWYAIFGSGPSTYDGTSAQKGHIYVVDLLSGNLLRNYEGGENNAFMASAITVDVGLNYSVDVGYIGETYEQGGNWRGKVYRMAVPILDDSNPDMRNWVYDPDPANWEFAAMLSTNGPITTGGSASIDFDDAFWYFVGTGRYYSDADRNDTADQYMYGVKDPYYNRAMYYRGAAEAGKTDAAGHVIAHADLTATEGINVYTDGSVDGAGVANTWDKLVESMDTSDGWYFKLTGGERILTEAKILGGVVLVPTFTPDPNPCGFGGLSSLVGLYFQTGTPFTEEIFDDGTTTVGTKEKVEAKTELGLGMGSSVGIHVGRESGARGYIQQSTGVVKEINLNPAFQIKSGIIWWREK